MPDTPEDRFCRCQVKERKTDINRREFTVKISQLKQAEITKHNRRTVTTQTQQYIHVHKQKNI